MDWVWTRSRARHGARLALLYIAWAIREKGDGPYPGWAWPSNAELADKTGLSERAVHTALAELVKIGELEVRYNAGPKGCNLYRVITRTPAESAPPQNLHPADTAPPQNFHDQTSAQVNGQTPADTAPPAESAPPQDLHHPPAESAPGTGREPEVKISPTERSTPAKSGNDSALFAADSNRTAPKPKAKRGRPAGQTASDPQFAEWYATYPVHKAVGDAERAYANAIRDGADPRVLLEAAKRYRDDPQVLRGWGKHPATWLNKKCWLDEDMPAPQQQDPPAHSNGYQPYRNPEDQSVYDLGFADE
jgi:Helix-turn-helix domain